MFLKDLAGSEVKFDRQGDGLARYDILNYQRLENSSGYQYKVWAITIYHDHDSRVSIFLCSDSARTRVEAKSSLF